MNNKISVILGVYNEEERIVPLLKGLSWCDDIIVIDKGSNDRTAELCKGDNVTLMSVPYTDKDGDLSVEAKKIAKHDWIACVVASDFIDYSLVKIVNELISSEEFNYNTIVVPFKNYILGRNIKHNPWYVKNGKRYFFRKTSLNFSNEVHKEVQYDTESVYSIKTGGYVYHFTHQSVISQNERHMRYTQREAEYLYNNKVSVTKVRWELIKKFFSLLIKNQFVFRDNDTFALNVAFLSYYVDRYLFLWEKNQDIEKRYDDMKKRIIAENEKAMSL